LRDPVIDESEVELADYLHIALAFGAANPVASIFSSYLPMGTRGKA
jgi:hypothetical protein